MSRKRTEQSEQPAPAHGSKLMAQDLLDILRCPVTGSRLRQEGDELVSEAGGWRYPIRNGVAVLLPGEATKPGGGESGNAPAEA